MLVRNFLELSLPLLTTYEGTNRLSEDTTLYRMYQYVNSFGTKQFNLPLKNLLEFMLEYHKAYGRHCTWFQRTGDIHDLVTNLLRTKYCFLQNQQSHCTLEIQLS